MEVGEAGCNVRLCLRRLPEVTKAVLTPPHASRVVEDMPHLNPRSDGGSNGVPSKPRPQEVGEAVPSTWRKVGLLLWRVGV